MYTLPGSDNRHAVRPVGAQSNTHFNILYSSRRQNLQDTSTSPVYKFLSPNSW